jgi:uncharacterized protein
VSALDDLKKEAKHWLKEIRKNNPGPVKRLRLAYPSAPPTPVLRDVQHALAREHGHESWKALTSAIGRASSSDAVRVSDGPLVDRFLDVACWDHTVHGRGEWDIRESAVARMVQQHPALGRENLYTAIVTGDLAHVETVLNDQPDLVNRKGGCRRWEPLLYLCYGRVDLPAVRENTVSIARLLLDRGANPNAYFPAGDALYSTLVGVAGEGEQDASAHVQRHALYELLLEHGAEPYDIQVLYNTHFRGDVQWWLELTYAYTLRSGRAREWSDPDWAMLDMGGYGSGARFLLWIAIEKNNVALARWLLEHGANPNAAPARAPMFSKRSLYEDAVLAGRTDIADLLLQHGAPRSTPALTQEESFIAACLRVDREGVQAALVSHPEYLMSPSVMSAVVRRDNPAAVGLLLDAGMPIDLEDAHGQRPLHVAAAHDARHVAAFLIERGATVDPVEKRWDATPLGFATHHGHREMQDLLSEVSADVWLLAYLGKVARLAVVLEREPQRAREVTEDGVTPLWWLPNDERLALRVADLLVEHGADPVQRSRAGKTASDRARERGLVAVADRLAAVRLKPDTTYDA